MLLFADSANVGYCVFTYTNQRRSAQTEACLHELLRKAGKSCGAVVKPGKRQRHDERLHHVV